MDIFNQPHLVYLALALFVIFYLLNNTTSSNKSDESHTFKPIPIDLNANGQIAYFIGTPNGHMDKLIVKGKDGRWHDIIDQTNLGCKLATYSAATTDIDHTGLTDLVVVREDGTTMYLNQGKGRFEKRKISGANDSKSSIISGDYNRDGNVDLYITQKDNRNVLLEGIGRGVFEDVTTITGTAGGEGSVSAAFVDINNDQWPDLVVGNDMGGTEIYRGSRGASGHKFTSGPVFYSQPDSDKTMTEVLAEIAVNTEILSPGIKGGVDGIVPGKIDGATNWIGLKLPNDHQFANALITIVSVDQQTGKIRKQTIQNVKRSDYSNDFIKANLGTDDRVLHLEVQTMYDGTRWTHPNPIVNKIMTFRNMRSNNFTAK